MKLIAARTNELDQHGAESALARHCQANRPNIDVLTTASESHGGVSEVSVQFAFFTLFHLAPELINGGSDSSVGLSWNERSLMV